MALNSAQKALVNDRGFPRDADAIMDPQAVLTPAGLPASLGDLWSQILDARKRYVSVAVGFTANATNRTNILAAGRNETITAIRVTWTTAPASAAGTILGTVRKRNGATIVDASATSIDLEAHTANVANALALGSLANRRLAPGDILYIDVVSNNADGTATGGLITIELEPTEV